MKQLIISDYDSNYEFAYVVIDNGIEIERSNNPKDIAKYGLYDEEWLMFHGTIDYNNNKLIKQFDMVIVCQDGAIDIYRKREE